jgi:enoyl-CoA hydratase/carnithine racemase
MSPAVISHHKAPIVWIKLNRPERLNAMNKGLIEDLSAALGRAESDENVPVIILHGEGRALCSGDDLRDLDAQTASEEATRAWVDAVQGITHQIMRSRKIVIAAVHGWCDAKKAVDVGIAWRIVPLAELLDDAEKLANVIAERPAGAVADIKHAINEGFHSSLADAMARETDATVRGFLSPEAQARAKEF